MKRRKRLSALWKWGAVVAGLVVYLLVYGRLERLARTGPDASNRISPSGDRGILSPPGRPEVYPLEDGGIEIRHDFFRRSTIRLRGEDRREALFACLEQGFADRFGEGSEEWDRRKVRSETELVVDECLAGVIDLPTQRPDVPSSAPSNDP